jgi:ABC-type sugar transport system substrate-binding protein
MLDEGKPDIVVAFPGGTGTADMVRRARKAGVVVIEVTNDENF